MIPPWPPFQGPVRWEGDGGVGGGFPLSYNKLPFIITKGGDHSSSYDEHTFIPGPTLPRNQMVTWPRGSHIPKDDPTLTSLQRAQSNERRGAEGGLPPLLLQVTIQNHIRRGRDTYLHGTTTDWWPPSTPGPSQPPIQGPGKEVIPRYKAVSESVTHSDDAEESLTWKREDKVSSHARPIHPTRAGCYGITTARTVKESDKRTYHN